MKLSSSGDAPEKSADTLNFILVFLKFHSYYDIIIHVLKY